ncbi:hypothetical protein [Paenibacillus periandrae]|uniref:hypothetical protein n=1 Tax=Paenibacillus periandrae TaxID=1761741 RepID=UPI001F09A2D6|nr:hypothetical protein [Paenibacillus periandrae]
MNYKIGRFEANNELFIHYTYMWNITNIQKLGLRQSADGLMGRGIYCCKAVDLTTREEIVKFLCDEIDWLKVSNFLPHKEHTSQLARDLIHPLYIEYTGPYLYGEENDGGFSDIAGFVLIPKIAIQPNRLIIGCPVDSGIEPEFIKGMREL